MMFNMIHMMLGNRFLEAQSLTGHSEEEELVRGLLLHIIILFTPKPQSQPQPQLPGGFVRPPEVGSHLQVVL